MQNKGLVLCVFLSLMLSEFLYSQEEKIFGIIQNDSIGVSFDIPAGWYAFYRKGDYYLYGARSADAYMVVTPNVPGDFDDFSNTWHYFTHGLDMRIENKVEHMDSSIVYARVEVTTKDKDTVPCFIALKNSPIGYPIGVYAIKNSQGSKSHLAGLVLDVARSLEFYPPGLEEETLDGLHHIFGHWILNDESKKAHKYLFLSRNGTYVMSELNTKASLEEDQNIFSNMQKETSQRWAIRIVNGKRYLYFTRPNDWPMRMLIEVDGDQILLNGQRFRLERVGK